MNCEKYIGRDVHQATIVVAVMDGTGRLVMESILETEAATILQFFAGWRGGERSPPVQPESGIRLGERIDAGGKAVLVDMWIA